MTMEIRYFHPHGNHFKEKTISLRGYVLTGNHNIQLYVEPPDNYARNILNLSLWPINKSDSPFQHFMNVGDQLQLRTKVVRDQDMFAVCFHSNPYIRTAEHLDLCHGKISCRNVNSVSTFSGDCTYSGFNVSTLPFFEIKCRVWVFTREMPIVSISLPN